MALVTTLLGALLLYLFFTATTAGRDLLAFLVEKRLRLVELPGFIGLALPLLALGLIIAWFFLVVAVQLLIISLPIYLIIVWRKKKGLRALGRWWFRKLGGLAVRLRRANYLGYLMPWVGGAMLANWLAGQERSATPATSYAVILIQLAFLIGLLRPLRRYRELESGEDMEAQTSA